ncbi:ribosomal-protein-alanine N-acetyltransferase [Dechloromonas sp. TW-R-39-2]|uniref:ribosomal protein S18-alanine N-acetyltransferase n=1 Tax=Dechloromonas sp. TW-R-39-2 TaxID=2654218 RepID=UPI00193DC205|nr:ribosomal protein S18-alanine N-acetyltransferase [Dechloromonas sp. TW-R-39-2]QRM19681.1 ribosomal-protein-alanine N-acetyltransferase [Dechloromonas sp. TW-R-39-2]
MSEVMFSAEFFPMNERDLDSVAALEASLQAFPWSRANFADSLVAGHSVWVCRLGGDLVGFSVVMSVIDEAHLLTIGIDRRYQGQGYGGRMLRHAMETARLGGAGKLFLEVRPSNERAVALYRHFGFRQIGLRKGYYPAVDGREDALIFDKDLA